MKKSSKKSGRLTKTEKLKRLRNLLIRACNQHIKAGGRIISGGFTRLNGECCPVQCVINSNKNTLVNPFSTNDLDYWKALSEILGFELDTNTMWAFIDGFDSHPATGIPSRYKNDAAFKLGRQLQTKYLQEEDSNGN